SSWPERIVDSMPRNIAPISPSSRTSTSRPSFQKRSKHFSEAASPESKPQGSKPAFGNCPRHRMCPTLFSRCLRKRVRPLTYLRQHDPITHSFRKQREKRVQPGLCFTVAPSLLQPRNPWRQTPGQEI